ncbi:ABC transporter substrate-binding protein [Nocardioides houyundeii]|uniref:ABC transporter substrate-binding protein n=1 Tax=Nocardioides houyundeii TaxID=2045452 RepID=UPI000C75A85F|nr:ABC transporter substrate-binding protein [Nocardioides houyundeii]
MRDTRKRIAASLLAVGLLGTAGCTAAPDEGSDADGGLKTGNGVTDDTIRILSLTDLSGPGAAGGKPVQTGLDAYVEQLNEDGGIDGRKIELETADTQYDPQKAVQFYQGARDDVAAVVSYGTPTTDAIRSFSLDDDLLALAFKGPFPEENSVAQGTAFEVDTANLLTYVYEEDPDAKVGVLYQADAVGDGVKRGVEAVLAETGNKTVAEASVDASSQDLTAQITAMRKAGADHVLMGLSPGTTIAAVGAVSALDYDATLLSPGVAYSKALLALPVGPTMEKQMLITCSYPQWDQESEGNKAFKAALGDTEPNATIVLGWIAGRMLHEFLETAVEDGDLTPAGIIKAAQHSTVQTDGLTPDMTFGKEINERTPFRESQVCSVSDDGDDGVTVVKDWFESSAATNVELQ